MTDAVPPLPIRLNADARKLEILLPVDALPTPTDVLLAQIKEECVRLGIHGDLTPRELEERMRSCVYGAWLTVMEAAPPVPPLDGRVELLLPVTAATGRRRVHTGDCIVRAHTPVARVLAGAPGQPGHDLLGREIPPRPPRTAHLPCGENTEVSADGTELLAACAGEVVLRNVQLHVVPLHVHDGDLSAAESVLTSDGRLAVLGSLAERAAVEARNDVFIQGNVAAARIKSAEGSIAVSGHVTGTAREPGVLDAAREISCDRALHAELHAGGDVYIQCEARHTLVQAGGNLHLSHPLNRSLVDVHLRLGGGVILVLETQPEPETATERRHTRVPMSLQAALALHDVLPLSFHDTVVEELSPSGARCRLRDRLPQGDPRWGAPLQLKFMLPDSQDQVVIIARLVRVIEPGVYGISFAQTTERDSTRLTEFCLQIMRERKNDKPGNAADRGRDR